MPAGLGNLSGPARAALAGHRVLHTACRGRPETRACPPGGLTAGVGVAEGSRREEAAPPRPAGWRGLSPAAACQRMLVGRSSCPALMGRGWARACVGGWAAAQRGGGGVAVAGAAPPPLSSLLSSPARPARARRWPPSRPHPGMGWMGGRATGGVRAPKSSPSTHHGVWFGEDEARKKKCGERRRETEEETPLPRPCLSLSPPPQPPRPRSAPTPPARGTHARTRRHTQKT